MPRRFASETLTSGQALRLADAVIQSAHYPLFVLDDELRIRETNRALASEFELDADAVIGQAFFELDGGSWDIPPLREVLERALHESEPIERVPFEAELPRVGRRSLRVHARRVRSEEEQWARILLTIEDVTERERLLAGLERSKQELERSNRELESFAQMSSHDLQEPLRKIRAFGDRLASELGGELEPTAADYLERMLSASARAQLLIDDLLAYSRVAREPFEPQAIELDSLLEGVVADLSDRTDEDAEAVVIDSLPPVLGSPVRVRELFHNLIQNGIKFRRVGERARVQVSWEPYEEDPTEEAARRAMGLDGPPAPAGWALFRVESRGIGFAPEHAERIFRMFERLHGRQSYEGTGIGLALCRRIVDRHGGWIRAEGRPGEGATFSFTLPLAPKPEELS